MSDALRSIMQECEGHRFGQSGYDITLDHIYDMAEVALAQCDVETALRAAMVDPTQCVYCEGTGWIFLDKSYDGYAFHGGQPYVEPDDLNGGYEPCGRCNSDREVEFGSGEKVKPWRRWTDGQVAEIVAAIERHPESGETT